MSNHPLAGIGNAIGSGLFGSSAPAGTRAQGGSWTTGSGNCSGILSSNSGHSHTHSHSHPLPGSLQREYENSRVIEMIRGTCNAQSIPIDLLATILPDMLHCTKAMAAGKEDKAAAARVLVAMMKRRMNNQTDGA